MDRNEILSLINTRLKGQGNQVDASSVLPKILAEILGLTESAEGMIGNLADLETDHKADLVTAINELFDVLETTELVVSMSQTAEEVKAVYDECIKHPQLSKNVVFYEPADNLYYRVNGYNIVGNALHLHTIMKNGTGLRSLTIQILSNGTIAVI